MKPVQPDGIETSGFTLVEVMVALMIGVLTVTLAFQLFRGIEGVVRALRERDVTHTREVNARRWLTFALASVDVTPSTGAPFESFNGGIRFVGWVQTPEGWSEARPIEIGLVQGAVEGRIPEQETVRLWSAVDTMLVDYLEQRGARAPWLSEWASSVIAPVAIRIRLVAADNIDTVLVAVGGGG